MASFGCATLSASTRSAATLLAAADQASYATENAGRNQVGLAQTA